MLARMFFLFTVCALMSACTASANHWDAAHADTPLTTTTPYQFIGHY
jgi:outer membrane biogenesis lipoprotein LolB